MGDATFALFASFGPSGATPEVCVVCGLFVLGPFYLLAVAARSFLGSEPAPLVLLVPALGIGGWIGYLLWLAGWPHHIGGVWVVWWLAAVAGVGLLPLVLVREGGRRNWFRPTRRPRRRDDD